MRAPIAPTDLAYAAGIIDGEGTIGITEIAPSYEPGNRKRRRKSPQFRVYLAVVMSDPDIPEWLSGLFGTTTHRYPPRKPGQKGSTHWRLHGERAANVCAAVLPYLKLKREQAELAIAFVGDPRCSFPHTSRGVPPADIEHRRQYVARAQTLNQRGVPA